MTFSSSWKISINNNKNVIIGQNRNHLIFLGVFFVFFCFPYPLFPQSKIKNIEIILDASESMNDKIYGDRKIDIAKRAIYKMIFEILPETTNYFNIGLRAFGEETEIDYKKDTRLLIPVGKVDLQKFKKALDEVTPRGYSPMAYSLLMASFDFPIFGDNMIMLITDGHENCGGDLIKSVQILKREGLNVVINVIGYGVDKEDKEKLKEVAYVSGGVYNDVNNSEELEKAFESIVSIKNITKETKKKVKLKTDTWIEREPMDAAKYSLLFPGLGQFYTDRPVKGVIDFAAEWTLIGFNYGITQTREYRNKPNVSFVKDFLDFSCFSYYISGSAGAYLYTKNRNKKEHWKVKSPEGAFLRSMALPGWGQLYIGDNPEAGLSYICWTAFFYYKLIKPAPSDVDSDSSDIKDIRTNSKSILGIIYGLQILTFISAQIHNVEAIEYQKYSRNDFNLELGFLNKFNPSPQIVLRKIF